ncbi:MAG TPA: hypothetical protein VG326_10680, partial [Tepidisphaeraceae bacterium]|nr:hypothetical protein [Tepidisphaeraceae bacterium]
SDDRMRDGVLGIAIQNRSANGDGFIKAIESFKTTGDAQLQFVAPGPIFEQPLKKRQRLCVVAAKLQRPGKIESDIARVRIEPDRFLIGGDRMFKSSARFFVDAELAPRSGIVGVDAQREVDRGGGLSQITAQLKNRRKDTMRSRTPRRQLGPAPGGSQRLVQAAGLLHRHGKIVVRRRKVRRQRDRLPTKCDRAIELTVAAKKFAEICQQRRMAADHQGPFQKRYALAGLPGLMTQNPKKMKRVGFVGGLLKNLPIDSLGLGELPRFMMSEGDFVRFVQRHVCKAL